MLNQIKAFFHLIRPHQWVKNLFVAAPLVFTPEAVNQHNMLLALLGFVLFSFTASAVYIMNDYKDREADRNHPKKKGRPLAAGTIHAGFAALACMALAAGSFVVSFAFLSPAWSWLLLGYFGLNLGYSFGLKHVPLLDVLIVAAGFVLRIIGGSLLIEVEPTALILLATFFLALFIAFAKRRDDLEKGVEGRKSLDGYNKPFIDAAMLVLATCGVLTYTLWTLDMSVMLRLGTDYLYATVPFVVLGFMRYLQLCFVEERGGNPTKVALTDKVMPVILILWFITFISLVYVG